MINSKILFRVVTGILAIAVIVSLSINYVDYKKTQRENQYVQSVVHQFKIYVNQSAFRLGYHTADPSDYPRGAAEIAAAGSELLALGQYEQMVNKRASSIGFPPHAATIANFLSFISLSLINDSAVYSLQDGTKYTISRQKAKDIVLEINKIFISNINENYTPPYKIDSMFNQIYNKIIPSVVKNQLAPGILDSWSLA